MSMTLTIDNREVWTGWWERHFDKRRWKEERGSGCDLALWKKIEATQDIGIYRVLRQRP